MFVSNFYVMYMKILYKSDRIPDTKFCVIANVYDLLEYTL